MKKRILISAALFMVNLTMAQHEKGETSIGAGGLALIYNDGSNPAHLSGLILKGSFGVFLSSRFSLENNLFYYRNNNASVDGKIQSKSYGILFGIRYHQPMGNSFTLIADAGFGFGGVTYTDDYNSSYWKANQYDSGIFLYTADVGTLIRLHKSLFFELLIPYLVVNNTSDVPNIYNDSNKKNIYNSLASPTVGLRYIL